jgi:phosphonate transport system substrate-binding protein
MFSQKRIWMALAVLVVLGLTLVACQPRVSEPELGTAENPIVFVFTPSGVQERVVAGMEAVGSLLEEETGYVIETRLVNNYNAAVEALCSGQSHISHMGSFPYLIANERCGIEPAGVFLRSGIDTYGTQIIARSDSGFDSLEDLAGAKPCWNDLLSASGYIVPLGLIGDAGIRETLQEPVIVGSHSSVVTSLYEGGICDFGATWIDARASIAGDKPDVYEVVSVVYASDPFIPNDMFVFNPNVDAAVRQKLLDALIALPETEEGKAAYDELYQIEGIVPRDDSFFDRFRVILDASGLDLTSLFE